MTRPLRIEFENAWYHVMNRGTARCPTFTRDEHRDMFLNLLSESKEMFGIEIHGYCLMGNHYHLLMRTPEANLSRTMRHIDGVYTQRYNRSERRDGPLFRGRYKAIVIDADSYLVAVSRYIHRNPIDARLCEELSDYPWSSYPAFVEKVPKPSFLTIDEILRYCYPPGIESYRTFVENPLLPSLREYYESKRVAPILGGKAFRTFVMMRSQIGTYHPEIPQIRRQIKRPSVRQVIESTGIVFGYPHESLLAARRGRGNIPRRAAMYVARKKFGHRLMDIADAFSLTSYSSVSSAVHKFESIDAKSESVRELLARIVSLLES